MLRMFSLLQVSFSILSLFCFFLLEHTCLCYTPCSDLVWFLWFLQILLLEPFPFPSAYLFLPPRALHAGFMASFIPFGSSKQIFLVFPLLYFSSEFANCFHSESLAVFPVFLRKRKRCPRPSCEGGCFWQRAGPKVCCYSPMVVAGFPSQPTQFFTLISHQLLFSGLFYIPLEF